MIMLYNTLFFHNFLQTCFYFEHFIFVYTYTFKMHLNFAVIV